MQAISSAYLHHEMQIKLSCSKKHILTWLSSPYSSGGKLLVNLRMLHGIMTSGILPGQYIKICNEARIGEMGQKYLNTLLTGNQTFSGYNCVVKNLSKESTDNAIREETLLTEMENEDPNVPKGLSIYTDARHCWRKNAKFSDIVAMGQRTHKILRVETVSKQDEICSQKHELLGTKRIYQYFDEQNVQIEKHEHDNNASVTKFVRDERHPTINSRDTWHATKGLVAKIRKITTGPRNLEGLKWHSELSDKAAAMKTYIFWSMKYCGGDANKLQKNILNIIQHYKGNHVDCFVTSRCHRDRKYIPTKTQITDPVAEEILTKFLRNLEMYRHPDLFKYCDDTHWIETFNNALLQYHDKRIVFGKEQYDLRTDLAILDWNEHTGRPVTSETADADFRNPRRNLPRKALQRKT